MRPVSIGIAVLTLSLANAEPSMAAKAEVAWAGDKHGRSSVLHVAAAPGERNAAAPAARLEPHGDPRGTHALLRLSHAVLPVVEDRRAQDSVGAARLDRVHQMVGRARAA